MTPAAIRWACWQIVHDKGRANMLGRHTVKGLFDAIELADILQTF
jgi:hypothetical protein